MTPARAALITACIAEPDDDGPRLALSDLLQEEGHEEAGRPEWLRLSGYWRVAGTTLFWQHLFYSTSYVAFPTCSWRLVPRPLCFDCTAAARICWPIWKEWWGQEFLEGKRWLCDGCHEHRIITGSIHT